MHIEELKVVVSGVFSIYAILWVIPGTIMSAIVSLGDPKRIAFIDERLSKDHKKLQENWSSMLFSNIATRLFGYWLAYPLICHRVKTSSKKFKLFMWFNTLGIWSCIGALTLSLIGKA
ncbi:hypothetical protein BCT30_21230 [Enterovibrio norvegicus]|uniref:hypothetical protein n=1 Tax=Enterovibrio norvegicus TaxID=188144 RepID=UPI000C842D71|nr:hypothetical protein [Enterovibrio norvegicus]MCC4799862.1 hypothetical protein [Enterovibrio norvegicus]PMI30913.1 hypothetical protein BCU47_16920 [Enterovibrio norvegicus]PMI34656.1 hypothetical protein BCU46_20725 [Enterovibrio norvegicus]PMN47144.1 hypothetical protein BCT30_21230 [Enterovibrio norvegicus]TKF31266.1 hypothetical protein FCV83_16320 [Enterovibrio norvegicus]